MKSFKLYLLSVLVALTTFTYFYTGTAQKLVTQFKCSITGAEQNASTPCQDEVFYQYYLNNDTSTDYYYLKLGENTQKGQK